MSAAFDGSGYRQRVLATLRRRSSVEFDDPFFVADLDPAASMTDTDVQAHLVRVVAFLQRERNSAKYAGLAAELVRRRAEWELPLLDSESRARLRAQVMAARSSGDAERLAKVDGYLATVRERFGGVPASRIAGLRRLAAAAGVPAAVFDERLGRERIIPDTVGGGVEPLDAAVRRQIRDRLDELRTLRGGDRVGTASLWSLLDLPADASPHRVRAAYETLVDRNARRTRDREKTVTADLLAMVRARLVEADPAAYTAGVLQDAKAHIRPSVEEHVVLDGEVTPAAYEGLVRQLLAAGHGLPVMQARAVVAEVARDLGALVSTGAVVDYVVCGGCGRPEPVNGAKVCRYCDTNLYTTCTTCGWAAEAASVVCRHCGSSLRQSKQAADALAAVRQALEDGRPQAAAEQLAATRNLVAALGPPVSLTAAELQARVQASLAAANAGWRALVENLEARREDAAADGARWLAAQAVDVPGPDGRAAAEVLAELTAHQNVIRRRVEAAATLPVEAREAALVAVLASAADNREALAALASLPLSPPTGLSAAPAGEAVVVRWRPSSSVGPVSYRVVRLVADGTPPNGVSRRSLGTTRATELSDAGLPLGGVVVRYEVTAVSGERVSEPVTSAGVRQVDDVTELAAEQTEQGVHLTWRLDALDDTVTVERLVQAPPGDEPVQRTRAGGGGLLDTAARIGTTYTYRVYVEYTDPDGNPARTQGTEVTIMLRGRPEPVLGLAASLVDGQMTLRWGAAPESEVRIYAAPAAAGPAPLGPEYAVVDLASVGPPVRLVGTSRRGRLLDLDADPAQDVVYVPVTVFADFPATSGGNVGGGPGAGGGGAGSGIVGRAVSAPLVTGPAAVPTPGSGQAVPGAPSAASGPAARTSASVPSLRAGSSPQAGLSPQAGPAPQAGSSSQAGPPVSGPPAAEAGLPAAAAPNPPRPAPRQPATTVVYTVGRAGRRRRTLRVHVSADGPAPEMVLVAKPGPAPPEGTTDGHTVSRLPASTLPASHTLDVPLDGAALPWGIRLLPAAEVNSELSVRHPSADALVVR